MITAKKMFAFSASVIVAASSVQQSIGTSAEEVASLPDTGDVKVTINADKDHKEISPYIYGITDKVIPGGVIPAVIKQADYAVSSYNWETNYSNSGKKGKYTNDVSLIDSNPALSWDSPALYVDNLISRAKMLNIPVRLTTLPMMGKVAADSMGVVSPEETARWNDISFHKNEAYLSRPDTSDGVVYIDEYIAYIVRKYGTVSEGGINGYFLDSEPDKWNDKYDILEMGPIEAEELLSKSVELSQAVKSIDSRAFVFGPSVSGIQGCINLGTDDTDSFRTEGWFIDYYLSEMRSAGEKSGRRLLDVLDIHYYTEALTPVGVPVLTGNDDYCNAYRMQAVRTLWDSNYTENSPSALLNKQYTPLISALKASIRINYPGTRLSVSEYDFGGGDNISGAIAETDALGVFATEGVYLACLSPVSDNYEYQTAAMKLFTNYDGEGSSFGNTLVSSECTIDGENDIMSSVYAAIDIDNPENLNFIITNKNFSETKNFDITLKSDEYSYTLDNIYQITGSSSDISEYEGIISCEDNSISFEAEPLSIYLFTVKGLSAEESEASENDPDMTDPPEDVVIDDSSETVSETGETIGEETSASAVPSETVTTSASEETSVHPADATEPDLTEASHSEGSAEETESDSEATSEASESDTESHITSPSGESQQDEKKVAAPIKAIVSLLAGAVACGVVYILLFDKK
ncbi:MAG: glycoside hydrolase family 44 protein [Huintestinicola sp.]